MNNGNPRTEPWGTPWERGKRWDMGNCSRYDVRLALLQTMIMGSVGLCF